MIRERVKIIWTHLDSFGSSALSHNHKGLNNKKFKALLGNMAVHNPSNSDIYTVEMAKFVATFERVCMPKEFTKLFLISGGALAVENALKTAMDWKIKTNRKYHNSIEEDFPNVAFLHFRNAFHGRSGYTLSLTNTDPIKHKYFNKFWWPRVDFPTLVEGNNQRTEELENGVMNEIDDIIENNKFSLGGIIVEPIQAEGGDNHMSKRFWAYLRQVTRENDMLLIADEVQSGMGITGKMWAYQNLGEAPDIVCFGKKAQVCGIMVTNRIDDIEDNVFKVSSRINSTWGGNLTDMIRSRKIIEVMEKDDLLHNATKMGAYLLNELRGLRKDHPCISNIRGVGLMCAFDLPTKEERDKLIKVAYDQKLLLLPCGERSIRLRLMLDVNKGVINRVIKVLERSLNIKCDEFNDLD